MSNIYQKLWDSDHHRFSVSVRNHNGQWRDRHADILLDEQIAASEIPTLDLAKKPLFYRVNETKLTKISTYVSLITLLDNYVVDRRQPEINNKIESQEINEFINLILATTPLKIAFDYIQQELKISLTKSRFKRNLYRIWFKSYTNYFANNPVEYASGFEHIFVGEGKYHDESQTGKISGYHSWVKFYLDEKSDRVNFFGHKYDLKGKSGIENPYIVSLRMKWQHQGIELYKNKGCFFIGTSPEFEIAMATVAFYESLSGKFSGQKRYTTINSAAYELVVYRNIQANGARGDCIRSFYPILIN